MDVIGKITMDVIGKITMVVDFLPIIKCESFIFILFQKLSTTHKSPHKKLFL